MRFRSAGTGERGFGPTPVTLALMRLRIDCESGRNWVFELAFQAFPKRQIFLRHFVAAIEVNHRARGFVAFFNADRSGQIRLQYWQLLGD